MGLITTRRFGEGVMDLFPGGGVARAGVKGAGAAAKAVRSFRLGRKVETPAEAAAKSLPKGFVHTPQAIDNAVAVKAASQTPAAPLAGRTLGGNFPTAVLIRTTAGAGAVGAGIYVAPRIGPWLSSTGAGAKDFIQQPLEGAGAGTGSALADSFTGLGQGLAAGLTGLGIGTGSGLSAAIGGAAEGVGKAVTSLAGPAILIGGGLLLYSLVKK